MIKNRENLGLNNKTEFEIGNEIVEYQKIVPRHSLFGRFVGYLKDAFKTGNPEIITKTKTEIENIENKSIRNGVNFSRCQMDKVLKEYNSGRTLEIDCFSPYLADYNLASGEIWDDKMTNTDKIALETAKAVRSEFPKGRIISLYDEYNTDMPDSENIFGTPVVGGSQIILDDNVKEKFKLEVERVLRKEEIIKESDKEGENYILISESEKIKDAENLVQLLENKGNIRRDGEAIYFVNLDSENPNYSEIILRTKNGRWMCPALDASSFLKPENLDIVHLVILPNHFKIQQDQVWEILRVLGISGENYHNIFYDEQSDPQIVRNTIVEEINLYKNQ